MLTNSVEYNTQYGYVQGASAYGTNATTPMVASITQGSGTNAFNLAYTYDSRGNITSETRNSVTTTYEYDKLGQLVRVNDPNDHNGSGRCSRRCLQEDGRAKVKTANQSILGRTPGCFFHAENANTMRVGDVACLCEEPAATLLSV